MTEHWPAVHYDRWGATCDTLHAHTQVLGKLAVELAPSEPELLHAALRLTARGWETGSLPAPDGSGSLVVVLDLHAHEAVVEHSRGSVQRVPRPSRPLTASSRATLPTPSRSWSAGGLGTPTTGRPSTPTPIRRRPASPVLPCPRRPPAGTRPWASTSWTGMTSAPPPTRMPWQWTSSARPFTMATGRPDGAPSSVLPRKAGRPPYGDPTTGRPDHREHDHAAACAHSRSRAL